MSLLTLFQFLENLSVSAVLRETPWLAALLNVAHLLALVVFAGAVLIVDLRLLGRGLIQQPLAQVARDARPWLIAGFLGLVVTGVPQLMSTAMKEYYSPFFWLKMEVLLVAVIVMLTIRQKVTEAEEARLGPLWGNVVGLMSLTLWSGVAISARLIGLFS